MVDAESADAENGGQPGLGELLDPQERGIIRTLYETSLQNFVMFRKLAKESNRSHPQVVEQAHVESLQKDFVRFSIWGGDFEVAAGKLDDKLQYSESLREDLILVLLHLCDALYQGLPYLLKTSGKSEDMQLLATIRLLEIAQSYIEENVYIGIHGTSFANIVDEVSSATDCLGDLNFCLEVPAVDWFAVRETPSESTASPSHQVYEEILRHRFPKADPAVLSQHATANYFRFIRLQTLRREAEATPLEALPNKVEHSPVDLHEDEKTETVVQTAFHDSGIGTSRRHESSYTKSLMSFTKGTEESYAKLLPMLPEAGALGGQFDCSVCLRKVQYRNKNSWNMHVIEDLSPYVCIFQSCSSLTEPFENRIAWLDHLNDRHGVVPDSRIHIPKMQCSLCTELVDQGQIAHMESHLIEIALSVMPTNEEFDTEEVEPSGINALESTASPNINEPVEKSDLVPVHDKHIISQRPIGSPAPVFGKGGPHHKTTKFRRSSLSDLSEPDLRPFPCLLATYGCRSSFVSKNEWKRHIATQHFKRGFWRCDLCSMAQDRQDPTRLYHYDFDREDIFIQHSHRMHGQSGNEGQKSQMNEDDLAKHVRRFYVAIRGTPLLSYCVFCERLFIGSAGWGEWLEHMGRHLELKYHKRSGNPVNWKTDPALENWMLKEGLIARNRMGEWELGDGKPLRLKVAQTGDAEEDAGTE